MKANELRIGNKLLKDGVIVTIDGRSIFDIWSTELPSSNLNHPYQPIPTSERFLLESGFTRPTKLYNYIKNDVRITLTIKNEWVCPDALPSDWVYLPYVHQVQNLYFALKGEEI